MIGMCMRDDDPVDGLVQFVDVVRHFPGILRGELGVDEDERIVCFNNVTVDQIPVLWAYIGVDCRPLNFRLGDPSIHKETDKEPCLDNNSAVRFRWRIHPLYSARRQKPINDCSVVLSRLSFRV
jgi:hypothetical protein